MATKKTVTVKDGSLTVEVRKDFANDFRVLELLDEIQTERNVIAIVRLMKLVFGDKYSEVRDHFMQDDGRIPVEPVTAFFTKAMQAVAPKS